jgi:hypothetical protein
VRSNDSKLIILPETAWKMWAQWLRVLATCIAAGALALASNNTLPTLSADLPAFTYNSRSFLLHNKPYVIIGGQMDPQRIPPEYWRDRLRKARAMGLNTIFSYVFWNMLEPRQGEWRSDLPENDIARYFKIAQEEGLNVVLRPGPYICGEREWGGFPAWLAEVPDMKVRTYNSPFLNASKAYLQRLAQDLRHLQITKGGPLLMVQVENEYGSYGSNHQYTAYLRDVLRDNFEIPLYTNDGGVDWALKGGEVPGVLAAIDGDPISGFKARDQYITAAGQLGPLLDGEYYTLWPDSWGSRNRHNAASNQQISSFVRDLDNVLGANNSISLYMFHGGTNFGFSSGSLWKDGATASWTTSYDYGAPLDESGRTTELYDTFRRAVMKYTPKGSVPEPPKNVPRMAVPEVELTPMMSLFDLQNKTKKSSTPLTMGALGQAYGFVLYETRVNGSVRGALRVGDRPRDRVLVFVNGARIGVIDSTSTRPASVTLTLKSGDTLQLLVENLGRVNYHSRESREMDGLADPVKGIKGDVAVGNTVLSSWEMKSFPFDEAPSLQGQREIDVGPGSPPVVYSGAFTFKGTMGDDPAKWDTFLSIPNGVKGVVWVNGFNLGRYWVVGPQQSLYLPGTVLKPNTWNEVLVLELSPRNTTMTAVGVAERAWGNNPDPDTSGSRISLSKPTKT